MCHCMCVGGWRTMLWSFFSPSTFRWVLGLEPRTPACIVEKQCLYPLSYLNSPVNCFLKWDLTNVAQVAHNPPASASLPSRWDYSVCHSNWLPPCSRCSCVCACMHTHMCVWAHTYVHVWRQVHLRKSEDNFRYWFRTMFCCCSLLFGDRLADPSASRDSFVYEPVSL